MRWSLLVLLLSFNAHAFEMWSGEFHLTTKDDEQVGFLGSFYAHEEECGKQVMQDVVGRVTLEQFEMNKDLVLALADQKFIKTCRNL